MMKKIAFVLSSLLMSPLALAFEVSIVADRTNCLYRCGEEAAFTITAKEKDGSLATNGSLTVTLDNFGGRKFAEVKADLSKTNPITVKGALTAPGFLRARAGGKTFACGYEPEKIRQGAPCPADFDAFWAAAMKTLDETVPLDPIVTPLPEKSTKDYTLSRVSFATCNGRRVHGYLSVPTDRTKAPFPLRVQVPGAGCGAWSNNPMTSKGAICLFMSVFPFEPNPDLRIVKPKYEALNKTLQEKYGASSYPRTGLAVSREDSFYYPVILGINRAVNWAAARPDVDKTRVTYSGTSQGGGFGFYLMGLNKNFTKGVCHVPALTDLLGCKDGGRLSGWPHLLENAPADRKEAIERNAPYFDGANFAARIRIPVRVVVGFADTTCSPAAVYAGYNAIPSTDKKIIHGIGMGHGVFGRFYGEMGAWETR